MEGNVARPAWRCCVNLWLVLGLCGFQGPFYLGSADPPRLSAHVPAVLPGWGSAALGTGMDQLGVSVCLQRRNPGALRSAMSSEPPPPPQPPTHQASVGLLDTPRTRERSPSPLRGNVVPSPLPTRRTRTFSATVRASQGPVYKGVCKCFCRSKGHGFITPADGGPDIFLHISDVEGEYVPVEGDEVTYKMCSIPPKNEKLQAVEVVITHLAPGTKHETWSGHVVSS
ncbi:calcium-regulated heat-stable protein 1 isoform X1 [Macaca fascicularis]|uniref:calcium-regulated heat-stable protein 1 isoform X1 n=1 Tax=Macaca fascicularis TaxID=9541 RepID=UPI0032B087AD